MTKDTKTTKSATPETAHQAILKRQREKMKRALLKRRRRKSGQ